MLKAYGHYGTVFVEITRNAYERGGPGWDFGTCLWIPTRNAAGADRYRPMREVSPGNLVLHINAHDWDARGTLESRLCGASIAVSGVKEIAEQPPKAGIWADRAPYYRIELTNYAPFSHPVKTAILTGEYGGEIRRDIEEAHPRFYPFSTYGDGVRTVQGIYLARCTPTLLDIFARALKIEAAAENREDAIESHLEFTESRRLAGERYFFARNPGLIREAKRRHGNKCQVCGFVFEEQFGSVARDFIEAHHLNPLSERSDQEWTGDVRTSIDQIAVLCANCHRVAHRRRPAYTLEELRECLRQAGRLGQLLSSNE
jgi:hypothetical protein